MVLEIDKKKTGARIRALIDLRGLSVKDVCRILSLGCVQRVYKWMDGVNLPSLDNIYCLSVLLQVPMDALVCGKGLSEGTEHTEICTKRVLCYHKKIRNHAAT